MFDLKTMRRKLAFMQGNLLVLTVTQTLGAFTRGMVFPYASLFVLALGGEAHQVGLVASLRPLLGLALFPIAGYLADRTGRVGLVALGGYLSAAALFLHVIAPTWQILALAGLLQGLMVIQFPASSALLADSLHPSNRGKGSAVIHALPGLLALASPYIGGTILNARGDEMGMRILYAIMTLLYLTSAIINQRFLRETTRRETTRRDPEPEGIRLADLPKVLVRTYGGVPAMIRGWSPSLRAMAAILVLGFTANAISGAFWVIYAIEEIGLSTLSWGLILLIEALVLNVMYLPAGLLTDRVGRAGFVSASLLLSLLAVPSFLLVKGFWGALLVRASIATANAFFAPSCSALLADTVPRETRARVMAAIGRGEMHVGTPGGGTGGPGMGFLTTIPVMLASLAGGYLYAANPAWPWYAAMGILAICLLLAWRCVREAGQVHE